MRIVLSLLVLSLLCALGCSSGGAGKANGSSSATARSVKPSSAKTYYVRGNTLFGKRDFAGAIAAYSKAIAKNRKYTEAYNNRALARKAQGDFDGAIRDCSKSPWAFGELV